MDIQIVGYIVFLAILFIIYFINNLFRKNSPPTKTHDPPTTTREQPVTYDPDWWDIYEKNVKETEDIIKFCEYCGQKYEKEEKYCHLCGTGLKESTGG